MWNLLVFALLGLLAGAAARLLYPGRQPLRILGTIVLGILGGLAGGMLSWMNWPEVEGQFQSGNLLGAILGAMLVIVVWASVTYARSVTEAR
jgi:uncharacterized membrane protein YeaQ/YmgE (transglycosylase-associated protein family)